MFQLWRMKISPNTSPIARMPAILGSSQGLFCIYTIQGDPIHPRIITKTAVLWNPAIRKSVAIDVPHVEDRSYDVISFGVCPHTSDPKLVKINYRYGMPILDLDAITFDPWEVEVYTLSYGAWRGIPTINQPRNTVKLRWIQVVIDGFIYWLVINCIDLSARRTGFEGYNLIVSFDMTSEKFMEVSLPATLACAPNKSVVISKLKESLVVVESFKEAEKKVYCIWMMEHGVPNSFAKLFTINSPDASILAVIGFRDNQEPIFGTRTDDLISGSGFSCYADSYMETLLLLDH